MGILSDNQNDAILIPHSEGDRFRYVAYGLRIASELRLPELAAPSTRDWGEAESPDVVVTLGAVADVDPGAIDIGDDQWMSDDRVWLHYTDSCQILVTAGREIRVELVPGVEERVVRIYVLGNAMGTLLHQRRGNLVLHAGAVAVDGLAVAFVGFSGAGKSTTTGAMVARGHPPIADDVVAIELGRPPLVRFGFSQLRLHPDSAEALRVPESDLTKLHPDFAKLGHQLRVKAQTPAYPLGAIYVLDYGDEDESSIERLKPAHAVFELIRHSYASKMLKDAALAVHFDQVTALAGCVNVSRLVRPKRLADIENVARVVERDCKTNLTRE